MRTCKRAQAIFVAALMIASLAACAPNSFSGSAVADKNSSGLQPTGDGVPAQPTPTPPSTTLPVDLVAKIAITLKFKLLAAEITQITNVALNSSAKTFVANLIQKDDAGIEQANCQIPGTAGDFAPLQTSLQAAQINSAIGTTALPPGSSRATFEVTFLDGSTATYRLEVNATGIEADLPLAEIDDLLGFLDTLDANHGSCNFNL